MRFTKKKPVTVSLAEGSIGNWVGDPKADHVLVWFHGALTVPAMYIHPPIYANL